MGKQPNKFRTQQLTLSVIEPTCRYLQRLVATGLYGNTEADVAKNVVLEKIRQLIDEGKLVEMAPMAPDENEKAG